MKFFNLLHICLMGFLMIPFMHAMMPSDFPDDIYFSMSSSEPSSSPEGSGKLIPQQPPILKIEDTSQPQQKSEPYRPKKVLTDTSDDETVIASPADQEIEQNNILHKELIRMRDDFFAFNKLNAASINTAAQSEKAEKLRADLKLLKTSYFDEIPSWPGILKTNISSALRGYDQKQLEEERKLKIYFIPSMVSEPVNLPTIEKLADIPKNIISNLPNYPRLSHPIARTFIDINHAIVAEKSEGSLAKAIHGFQKSNTYKKFTIDPDILRIKNPDEPALNKLKVNILNHYLFELSQPYVNYGKPPMLDTNTALNKIIPNMCQSIPLFLKEMSWNQQSSNSELLKLNTNDFLMITQYLKQKDESLTPNISLITDIVLRAKLNNNSMQACLLLLNKVGKFYPQIQSDLAHTIIDDIATNYFTLSQESSLQTQNIAQAIKWLIIVPELEPLFSETLLISDIAHDKLEDYLEKITLLELNCNPSAPAKQRLQELQKIILKEARMRSKQATVAKLQAKKEELEIAKKLKAEEVSKLHAKEKSLEAEKIVHTTNIAELQSKEKLYREEIAKLQAEEETLRKTITTQVPTQPLVKPGHGTPKQAEVNGEQAFNIFLKNREERRRATQNVEQEKIRRTPSFLENITNTISSWFNWFFWGPL